MPLLLPVVNFTMRSDVQVPFLEAILVGFLKEEAVVVVV